MENNSKVLEEKVVELGLKVQQLEINIESVHQAAVHQAAYCDHNYQRTISGNILQCEKCGKTVVWCFGLGWQ